MIDASALQLLLMVLTGWLERRERTAIAYLIEENYLLRRQLGGRRLRLTDEDRRRLAARAHRVGRAALREIATVATPDTLLRWHRQLIARKWTNAGRRGRRGILLEIRRLVVRMAEENPTWGYTRIQGALKNVGHRVGRSTIRRVLKAAGLPPVPQRPTSWQTFLKAHWGAIAGADFFTTDVWTWRGLVTDYTVFVIDLASRRVHVLGSTPHPSELFMGQMVRLATAADDGVLIGHRVLICDRDRKWSRAVRHQFGDAGIRVVLTPERASNANAYAERFVRSIKEECLDRMIPLGERHFRGAITEFVGHYHLERNHQGLDNRLITGTSTADAADRVRRRSRLGGLLNYYERAGTVNLLRTARAAPSRPSIHAWSAGVGRVVPGEEGSGSQEAVMRGPEHMPPDAKEIAHEAMDRHKALRLPDRLESSHLPLALAGRLMRQFGSIVFVLRRAVYDRRHHPPVGRRVAAELIR